MKINQRSLPYIIVWLMFIFLWVNDSHIFTRRTESHRHKNINMVKGQKSQTKRQLKFINTTKFIFLKNNRTI